MRQAWLRRMAAFTQGRLDAATAAVGSIAAGRIKTHYIPLPADVLAQIRADREAEGRAK